MWVTPLQLATAVAILANRGTVTEPRMLKSINALPFEADTAGRMADVELDNEDYWRYMEDAMVQVVHRPFSNEFRDYGTAFEAIAQKDRSMPYRMAGKSGTAQVVGISQNILKSTDIELDDVHRDHGLFVSFAPAQNPNIMPKIALAVFVENGEHGSSVAGPIAKKIIDTYLLDILGIDFNQLTETGSATLITSSP
jgi:penicillin-binding protein 2